MLAYHALIRDNCFFDYQRRAHIMNNHHEGFKTVTDAKEFILGGAATFTVTSNKTNTHYTYKVNVSDGENPVHFVNVLSGPDNTDDYMYLGIIRDEHKLQAGKKGRPDAPSFKAFEWVLKILNTTTGDLNENVTIQHEGRCCRCNRPLTDPVSIATGMGPICRGGA